MTAALAAAGSTRLAARLTRNAWLLPLAAVAALLALLINEASFQRSSEALARLAERSEARFQIQTVYRAMVDAETGQRGYLLTARKVYLEPYSRALVTVPAAMTWLEQHFNGDVATTAMVKEFKDEVEGKLAELATMLDIHEQGRDEAWRALLMTDIGREKMDRLRALGDQMLARELESFAAEKLQVNRTLRLSRIGVALMIVASMLGFAILLRQRAALDTAQRNERERLEIEVAGRTAELTQLAQDLQSAREDERGRLARELHDELGALLTAAKLDAARLKRGLAEVKNPEFNQRLEHLVGMLNDGIGLKRRIIEDLRPSSLSNLGLKAAVDILAGEFGERARLKVSTHIESFDTDEAASITLYRLVQESLTNVAKYADAHEVEIRMTCSGERILATVRDDGKGFDASRVRGSAQGLVGMRYRVQARGGQLEVTSSPGRGTRISATMPLRPPPREA